MPESTPERAVYLLDADPDLAEALDPDALAAVRPYVVARVQEVDPGRWDPGSIETSSSDLGLLVLDGLLTREVDVCGRAATELLGNGDLLRPWDLYDEAFAVPGTVQWTAMAPTRLAVIDARFTIVAARCPELMSALVGRAFRRARTLVYHQALAQITGVDTRVLLALWELAHRWGFVGPNGVTVPVNVTHEMLAQLIGARRPTVTTSLGRLERAGEISRSDRGWTLHRDPATVADLLDVGGARTASGG